MVTKMLVPAGGNGSLKPLKVHTPATPSSDAVPIGKTPALSDVFDDA
jgi:hypothetical protein